MAWLPVLPVILHWKPFIYTDGEMTVSLSNEDENRTKLTLFTSAVRLQDGYPVSFVQHTTMAQTRTLWIQKKAQMQLPPLGQAGMSAGTWKSLFKYHGQVCMTLKMTKSSGWTSAKSFLYAMPSAQPAASSMLFAWMAVVG